MPLPFVEHIGARILEANPGTSRLSLAIQPQHFNSSGVVHGGVLFTLADTAMGAALFPLLDATQGCATIEIKINYFRPVTAGELGCQAHVVHRGRSTANLEAVLSVDAVVVGKANGTFAIFPRRAASVD